MADEKNVMSDENGNVDAKAAKKAAKEAKKAEKLQKEQEKRRKKMEKAGMDPESIKRALDNPDYEEESGGSRLAVFFVTLVIIAVWLAILALLVKMDVEKVRLLMNYIRLWRGSCLFQILLSMRLMVKYILYKLVKKAKVCIQQHATIKTETAPMLNFPLLLLFIRMWILIFILKEFLQ